MAIADRITNTESAFAHVKDSHQARATPIRTKVNRFRRFVTMARVVLDEALRFLWFSRLSEAERRTHTEIPEHFVSSLLKLGPTFIKIGQILSTRPDFLPNEYIAALQVLQENVPPFPYDEVVAILRAELGRDTQTAFKVIEEQPVAAASLAQVHFAVLTDGTPVAAKVQRPGIHESINEVMEVLSGLVRFASHVFPKTIHNLNLVDGFNEFRRYTLQELDFAEEAKTIERFRESFKDFHGVVFPKVYARYTTTRVLTLERVSGVRLQELAATIPFEARRALNTRLLELEMKMFISKGLFHADLHPGNIFFQADGKIALVDFGMYGEITEAQRDHFVLYFLAVVQKQTKRAFYHLTCMTRQLAHADEEAYYRRFKELAEKFFNSTLSQTSLTQVYLQILLEGAKYGFVFPSDLLLHAKAVTTAEALMLTLVPDLKFETEARPIVVREYVNRAMDFRRLKAQVEQVLPELLLFGELPPAAAREDRAASSSDDLWNEVGRAMVAKTNLWKQSVDLIPHVLKPFVRRALKERYSDQAIDAIVERMRDRYRDLEPSVPTEASLGGDLMVHLGAFTIAMYRALTDFGHSKDEATDLVYDIVCPAYSRMGEVPWALGAKFSNQGYRRLAFALDAFLTFPFSAPAYRWEKVDAGENVYAFDMVRCPVAEYFRAHGLADLAVKTWCNLDFPLAEQWCGKLERTSTLAAGGPRCDFRWKWLNKEKSKQPSDTLHHGR